MAKMLEDGPIRKLLREKGVMKRSPEAVEKALAKPVTIDGVTIGTDTQAHGFRTLYGNIMPIYDKFNDKCLATRSPYWCTSSQILGILARKMMRARQELEEQGAW